MFHWDCLERFIEGGSGNIEEEEAKEGEREKGSNANPTQSTSTHREPVSLRHAKCPLCSTLIIPTSSWSNEEASPLLQHMRKLLASTKWASQLPPPPPPSSKVPQADHLGKTDTLDATMANEIQPNGKGEASMITIEMGGHPSFPHPSQQCQPGEAKIRIPSLRNTSSSSRRLTSAFLVNGNRPLNRWKGAFRILLNCLTLRNVRFCSLGSSPRQSIMLILLLMVFLLAGTRLILPIIMSSASQSVGS